MICNLVKVYNLRTTGFVKALELAAGSKKNPIFKWVNVIPDAYTVVHGLVIVYEVEDTHPVKGDRLRIYMRLWQQLDDMDWELQVKIVNVSGHMMECPLVKLILEHDY
jgi:hypothetical protein